MDSRASRHTRLHIHLEPASSHTAAHRHCAPFVTVALLPRPCRRPACTVPVHPVCDRVAAMQKCIGCDRRGVEHGRTVRTWLQASSKLPRGGMHTVHGRCAVQTEINKSAVPLLFHRPGDSSAESLAAEQSRCARRPLATGELRTYRLSSSCASLHSSAVRAVRAQILFAVITPMQSARAWVQIVGL